jgi:hypothetical protein
MDLNNTITSKYIINCANLDQVQIKTERIRRGQFKTTDVGIFNGQEVGSARSNTCLIRCSTDKDKVVTLNTSPYSYTAVIDTLVDIYLLLFSIKLIDFDYFNNNEPTCKTKCPYNLTCHQPENSGNKECGSGTTCHRGICIGLNARINIVKVNDRCSTDKDKVVTLNTSPYSYTAVIDTLVDIYLLLFSCKGFTQ